MAVLEAARGSEYGVLSRRSLIRAPLPSRPGGDADPDGDAPVSFEERSAEMRDAARMLDNPVMSMSLVELRAPRHPHEPDVAQADSGRSPTSTALSAALAAAASSAATGLLDGVFRKEPPRPGAGVDADTPLAAGRGRSGSSSSAPPKAATPWKGYDAVPQRVGEVRGIEAAVSDSGTFSIGLQSAACSLRSSIKSMMSCGIRIADCRSPLPSEACLVVPVPCTDEGEGVDEWEKRRRVTGVAARLVKYENYDRPRCDFQLRGGGGRRLEVHSVRPGGKADAAGVKAGDILASIDGHRGFEHRLAESVMRSLNAPCSIVFLGFIGKLAAEVRMATRGPPPIGMSPGCKLLSEGWSRTAPPPPPPRRSASCQKDGKPSGSIRIAEQVELRPGRGAFFLATGGAIAAAGGGEVDELCEDNMGEEEWEAIEAEAMAAAAVAKGEVLPDVFDGATTSQPDASAGLGPACSVAGHGSGQSAASDADAAAGIGADNAGAAAWLVEQSADDVPSGGGFFRGEKPDVAGTSTGVADEGGRDAIFELRAVEARQIVTMALLCEPPVSPRSESENAGSMASGLGDGYGVIAAIQDSRPSESNSLDRGFSPEPERGHLGPQVGAGAGAEIDDNTFSTLV
mmetsp:Transcript_120090/g.346933  ORF Transcript_120090/g.346933 Transcript_120090/m.346933 type:complete len:628 (-) Transcript_120090:87-1970(-)